MQSYQKAFLDFVINTNVLRFGEFTLKSGRISPYFFNSGLFNSGASIAQLGRYYAAAIENSGIDYDMIFGPAYKGIPLAVTTCVALADHHHKDVPYAFNRKEAKDHGEGGTLVGAPLQGRVLIIDDVISAGTSIRESIQIIENRMLEFSHSQGMAKMFIGYYSGFKAKMLTNKFCRFLSVLQVIANTYCYCYGFHFVTD